MNGDEAIQVLATRCQSLEDILRQQEQTISVLLGRIRDLEQFVGNEARNRDANQNQINQLLSDRSTENLAERIGLLLQNQSERLSALQADAQAQRTALQGVDSKFDAAFHGLENKVQGDLRALQERLGASESATAEALRTTQSSLQSQAAAVQQVDAKCRDAVHGLQSMVRDTMEASRGTVEALEGRTRDALRDLHSTLSGDLKAASTQWESLVHQAIRNQNEAMLTLDQRVRAEVAELHQREQADFQMAQQRLAAVEAGGRELVQVSQSALAAEIAAVAKHSQAVDTRQQSAHQALVQELSKHDQQMETIDINWRAGVMDLNRKVDAEVAGVRSQTAAGDQVLQGQLGQIRDQLRTIAEKLNDDLNNLAGRVQDNCVVPLERLKVTVEKQDATVVRLIADGDKMREFLRVFSQEVDRNANQIRQLMDSTLRAAHADLLERINVVSASVALRQDPEAVYAQINDALSKIWSDSSSSFATQRDVNDIQSQLSALESAIRVEIHVLAEKDNDLHRRIDEVQVPLRRIVQQQQQAPSKGNATAESATTREVKQYVNTAEAAQNECFRMVNEVRRALEEVQQTRTLVETIAQRPVPPTVTTTSTDKGGEEAQPETAQLATAAAAHALSMERQEQATARAEALLAEVQQVQQSIVAHQEDLASLIQHERARQEVARPEAERVSSSPPARRVSGTQRGNTFFMRDATRDEDPDEGGPTNAVDAPSPTAYAGRNSEMLLPTHQFVRKEEYANFKDFTKQELDTLWVEVLNLRRTTGVSRDELMMHLSQSKSTILNGVFSSMMKHEKEMLAVLSSLKLQVAKSLSDGAVKTDVKIFPPHNGTIDIEQLIRDVDALPGRLSNPTTTTATTEPAAPNATYFSSSQLQQPPRYVSSLQPTPTLPYNSDLPAPVSAQSPSPRSTVIGVPVSEAEAASPVYPNAAPSHSIASSARSSEPLPAHYLPRVAPYVSGTAVDPVHTCESSLLPTESARPPASFTTSLRYSQPPAQVIGSNPQQGGVAAGPRTDPGLASAPASPSPSQGASLLPVLYAHESGSPKQGKIPELNHVTAWDPRQSGHDFHPAPVPTLTAKPGSAPGPRNAKGSAFHLNPLQGVRPLFDDSPAYPQERPIQSAPLRPLNQLAPLPNRPTTTTTTALPVDDAPRAQQRPSVPVSAAPPTYPTQPPVDPQPQMPFSVDGSVWEQVPSEVSAPLAGTPQSAPPSPLQQQEPPQSREEQSRKRSSRRRHPRLHLEEDGDDEDESPSDGSGDAYDDVSGSGESIEEPRSTRSARRKGARGSRKPRSRSGSRTSQPPSARRRKPSPSYEPPSARHASRAQSASHTPLDDVADPQRVDAEPALTAKPRPSGSSSIRVYPSGEGVRLGNYTQSGRPAGGTSGHIYAPGKDANRSANFSSIAYGEL